MYAWFWAMLRIFGITVSSPDMNIIDVNPCDIDPRAIRFEFTLFGKRLF